MGSCELDSSESGQEPVAGCCEHGNEPLGYGERGSPEPGLQCPAGSSGASGASLRMATTRRNSSNPTFHAATPENALPGSQQESVNGRLNSQAADAAPVRRLKKFTAEVNKFLMRTYYKVSKLETDVLHCRDHVHGEFNAKYPEYNASKQRLSDQTRVIINRNPIPVTTLNQTKEQVPNELQANNVQQLSDPEDHPPQETDNSGNIKLEENDVHSDNHTKDKLEEDLREQLK
jgi:hypothetical protein